MKEFVTAVQEVADADAGVEETFTEFKVDGRVLRAYQPTDGQLAFMLAALGRGQSDDQRFAAIINIMLSSMRDADRDYLEGRLLERDARKRLHVQQIEEIFEHLVEEWFARPTQSPSDSASSPQSVGPN